jgi:hypothetical protein
MNLKEIENIAKIAMAEELGEERTETEVLAIEIKSIVISKLRYNGESYFLFLTESPGRL